LNVKQAKKKGNLLLTASRPEPVDQHPTSAPLKYGWIDGWMDE
jgi:hypothetical protein